MHALCKEVSRRTLIALQMTLQLIQLELPKLYIAVVTDNILLM
jgi:hypothetical protein